MYAPTFNHRSEAHLAKAALSGHFRAPSCFITSGTPGRDMVPAVSGLLRAPGTGLLAGLTAVAAAAAPLPAPSASKDSSVLNREMGDACISTLRAGGSVLVPVDTAGRCLEVLLRLDGVLSPEALRHTPGAPPHEAASGGYPIFLLSHVSGALIEHAKTLLEFMNERLGKEFSETRTTPFTFDSGPRARVRVVQSVEPIAACLASGTPCVVMASFGSLQLGWARALMTQWASNPRYAVLFTSRVDAGASSSLAAQLTAVPTPSSVTYETSVTVPLMGAELRKWREAVDDERRRVARTAAAARARAEERAELAETVVVAPPVVMPPPPVSAPLAMPSVAAPAAAAAAEAVVDAGDSRHRVDAAGYTLDEDLACDCEYVDEVAAASMGGVAALGRRAEGAGSGDDGMGEDRPPGEEDAPPGMGASVAVEPAATGGGRKRGRTALGSGIPGGPAAVRFPMYSRDLGGDAARAGATEYGWAVDRSEFLTAPAPGSGATESVPVPTGSSAGGSVTSAALQALERLMPGGSAGGGVGGAAGPSASSLLASAVAATGLVRPGEAVPTKRMRHSVTLRISCAVWVIPLEGRVDGASLVHVLEEVAPGRVVLLRGAGEAALAALTSALRKAGVGPSGLTCPSTGVPIDVASGVSELSMPVRDALYSSLHFHTSVLPPTAGGREGGTALDVAFVRAQVEEGGGGGGPTLTLAPGAVAGAGHLPILLRPGGPLRLADVRKRLLRAGMEVETVGEAALVTKGGILLTRAGPSGGLGGGPVFDIEGPACAEYFLVRRVLYDLFTFV